MQFLDQARVYVRSGDGGAGCVSFRREKFIEFGGPDGGDGGKGGDVVVECVSGLNTLIDFRYQQHFKGKTGMHGMGKNRAGGKGAEALLRVPVGTQLYDEGEEEPFADFTEIGQRVIICKGGNGGFGNAYFKTSTNQAPASRQSRPGRRRADAGPAAEVDRGCRARRPAECRQVDLSLGRLGRQAENRRLSVHHAAPAARRRRDR